MTRTTTKDGIFRNINETSALTGLSRCSIRAGCKSGRIPCIKVGCEYRINTQLYLKQLNDESLANLKGGENRG